MTLAARGYGATHYAIRKRLAPVVANGDAVCTRCGMRIRPGEKWQLDHTDDRTAWLGPAHAFCNQSAGGKLGAYLKNGREGRRSRRW